MTLSADMTRPGAQARPPHRDVVLNLVRDPWIPIRRKNGELQRIRPAEIRDFGPNGDNPPVALAAHRPDFNGALAQFLVALLQTAAPPQTERDWRKIWKNPPSTQNLHARLEAFADAFDLDGEGACFMQGLEPLDDQSPKQVIELLYDTPAGITLDQNRDHFVKDRGAQRLCPSCTAMALLTLQLNATAGGPGLRTSVRGGGPLTTLILGRDLWETVWLNVVPTQVLDDWAPLEASDPTQCARVFPWLATTRLSDKDTALTTTPQDCHPAQVYWSMSRRARLAPPRAADEPSACCDQCSAPAEVFFEQYRDKQYGTNYVGPWLHPLTPYSFDPKDGTPNSAKGQLGGLSYRHWRGYVVNFLGGNRTPARVVQVFTERSRKAFAEDDTLLRFNPRLWAFGYDADKAKIRSWHESVMPIYQLPDELFDDFEKLANDLVAAASEVASLLRTSLRYALYGTPTVTDTGKVTWRVADNIKHNTDLFQQIDDDFWQRGEASFYGLLAQARDARMDAQVVRRGRERWARELHELGMQRFDRAVQFGEFHAGDPRAIVLARDMLRFLSSLHHKKFRELLDLPAPAKKSAPLNAV